MQGHRSLKQIDSVFDDGEERCTACIAKVRASSEELFHFSSKKQIIAVEEL